MSSEDLVTNNKNRDDAANRTKPSVIKINLKPCNNKNNVTKIHVNSPDAVDTVVSNVSKDEERDPPRVPRCITPSCQAVKHAVSDLYRIDDFHLEKIGVGFFSDVFKVIHKSNGKIMVLKLNKHQNNRTNVLKEVQLLNRLNHPNILRLEAACVNNGQLHALTEFIDGGNLEELIQNKDSDLPWGLRMSLALDVAKGLAYLHSRGMFHRDLTSKNILIRGPGKVGQQQPKAVIGDLGLATHIPKGGYRRLPQVGSPYWMSPECLNGLFYDEKADIFSYGIILCELIARLDADPDVLPRTSNFGVDYIKFSSLCLDAPPDFLALGLTCVQIEPQSRPTSAELVNELETVIVSHYRAKSERKVKSVNVTVSPPQQPTDLLPSVATAKRQRVQDVFAAGNSPRPYTVKTARSRSLCESGGDESLSSASNHKSSTPSAFTPQSSNKQFVSPSEKARFHPRLSSALSVGKEMSLRDPHYEHNSSDANPFLALPIMKKLVSDGHVCLLDCPCGGNDGAAAAAPGTRTSSRSDLFSSCFELPSPARVASPECFQASDDVFLNSSNSLPSSPACFKEDKPAAEVEEEAAAAEATEEKTVMARYFEDQMFEGRVQLLRRLYSGGCWVTQDDTALVVPDASSANPAAASQLRNRRRHGSCESGFFSSGTGGGRQVTSPEWRMLSYSNSARSIGSSLMTVSDLEEDLRAASLFLSSKRTSSVFTDSMEDLSSFNDLGDMGAACGCDEGSGGGGSSACGGNPLSRSSSLSNPSSSFCTGSGGAGGQGGSLAPVANVVAGKNCYEKDIRHIVDYFEEVMSVKSDKSCNSNNTKRGNGPHVESTRSKQASLSRSLQRSQKIESLIKRVVEKESRERFHRHTRKSQMMPTGPATAASSSAAGAYHSLATAKLFQQQQQQRLQVCDGIVRSKLPIFDASKRNAIQRSRFEGQKQGHVKARLAFFGQKEDSAEKNPDLTLSSKRLAEKRLQALANASSSIKKTSS